MNLERLVSDIKDPRAGEGLRLHPYTDTRGFASIGYGRNLIGVGISQDEADYLLRNDLSRVGADLAKWLPWTTTLDDVRQRVFYELAFNMGIRGLLGFRKMLIAAQAEDWVTARAELLASDWASQVQPARRDRLASMLVTGAEL